MMKLMSREVFNDLFNATKLVGDRVWIISRQFEPRALKHSVLDISKKQTLICLERTLLSLVIIRVFNILVSVLFFVFFRDIHKESMTEVFRFTPLKNSDEIIIVQDFRRGKENPIQIYRN